MNKTTLHAIAQRALEELRYEGWSVSAVWQQKTLPDVQSSAGKASALKTWCIDYTNKQGSFPRVYFRCEPGVSEDWVIEEIKRQLNSLQERLAFMDPERAAPGSGGARQQEQQPSLSPSPSADVSSAEVLTAAWARPKRQPVDSAQDAALLRAAGNGDADAVRLSLTDGANINARSGNEMTALIHAAFFGHSEVARVLVESGADRAAEDQLGMTALDWAKSRDNFDIVQLLTPGQPVESSTAGFDSVRSSGESIVTTEETTKAVSPFVDDLATEAPRTNHEEAITDAATVAAVVPRQARRAEKAKPTILAPSADLTKAKRRPASFYIGAALLGAFAGLVIYLASLYLSRTETTRNTSSSSGRAAPAIAASASSDKVQTAETQLPNSAPAISLSPAGPTPPTNHAERTDDAAASSSATGEASSSSSNARKEKGDSQTSRAPSSPARVALRSALNAWAAASKNRDIKKQMSFYAPQVNTFYQERDVSRPEVEAEKTKNNEQAEVEDVRTDRPEITVDKAGATATTRFKKRYAIKEKAGGVVRRGEVIQELRWRKTDAGWKIVSERDIEAAP